MNRRLLHRVLAAAIAGNFSAGVVAIAAEPTGAPTAAGVLPSSSRLADDVRIGAVHVLLVDTADEQLGVVVAYRGRKGWLSVQPTPAPPAIQAAWTTTPGRGPVPALSMTYGQTSAAQVRVQWSDGVTSDIQPQSDGSWLAVRSGNVGVARVDLLDAVGHVVGSVAAP